MTNGAQKSMLPVPALTVHRTDGPHGTLLVRCGPRSTVWEGVVHVFDLAGHPTATRAYAWSSPIEGSTKRRFFAALHTERINSPVEAVRAAIVAERRATATRR
jgi:hypothetical protein